MIPTGFFAHMNTVPPQTPDQLAATFERLRRECLDYPSRPDVPEEQKKMRGWRDKVNPLLLVNADYRKTKLWKEIRQRILERDQHLCRRCGGSAPDTVHHITYADAVILGQDDEKLVAICGGCHNIVHYAPDRSHRVYEDSRSALTDLSLNEEMPKVDRRIKRPDLMPGWGRFTAAQKEQWLAEWKLPRLR